MSSSPRLLPLALATVLSAGALAALPVASAAATLPTVDDFESPLAAGTDADGLALGFSTFQDTLGSTVSIGTTAPPAPVPDGDAGTALRMDLDVVSYAGFVHTFENPAVDTWVSQDWSAYAGLEFWLHGNDSGTTLFVDVLDNRNPGSTKDDAERWSATVEDDFSGWKLVQIPFESLQRKEIGNGAPNDDLGLTEVWGWALGSITTPDAQTYYVDDVALYGIAPERPLTVGFTAVDHPVDEGTTARLGVRLTRAADEPVTVDYATTTGTARPDRDYVPTSGSVTFAPGETRATVKIPTLDDRKYQGDRGVVVELSDPRGAGVALGRPPVTRLQVVDDESPDSSLVEDFERSHHQWSAGGGTTLSTRELAAGDLLAVPGQDTYEQVLAAGRSGRGPVDVSRTFPLPQDWSGSGGVSFWHHGRGTGRDIEVRLDNDRAAATLGDPSTWPVVWRDEFDAPAGTAPDPANWTPEIGDGTIIGKPGWGNDELQYYTDDPANAATDGDGNLVITTRATDPETAPQCYYGPCRYTSARLVSQHKKEFAYGRIEARIKVPFGAGLWPAFWSLGTDIAENPWPQSGEIDFMEFVGRLPKEIFGTIHGPGYSGGQSFGNIHTFDEDVSERFHTFTVDWTPERIVWHVDGIAYHEAVPADVAPNEWVFEHPFFLLLNTAVGGNFGGPVGADTTFPQEMSIDYVRVHRANTRPRSYTATVTDDVTGWRKITVPFSAFSDSRGRAPDLSAVSGFGLRVPTAAGRPALLDQVRLQCPEQATVTSTADSGPGSLRAALGSVCAGGEIDVDPALAGATVALDSALHVTKDVTVDGSAAPGLTLSGEDRTRVLVVRKSATAELRHLSVVRGRAGALAGGVLVDGALTLDHVTVADSVSKGEDGDPGTVFWQGGGGIYVGDGADLVLRDSTVRDNDALGGNGGNGGGVHVGAGSTALIERSTISGNTGNVGGALRSRGDVTVVNSTLSGNASYGWHGGAVFHSDGSLQVRSSTVTGNTTPTWGDLAAIFVAYGAPKLVLADSIVSGNAAYACQAQDGGTVLSAGHNLVQDGSCSPVASDLVGVNPLLGPLADNGGPTATHALLTDSPAVDGAGAESAPATDQRGVARPVGAGPDIGAFEQE
jgi:beta-glucanase (GH16 family)